MQVSRLFVVLMGMGTTFVGLTCIIFLTVLMGSVMKRFEQEVPPSQTAVSIPQAVTVPMMPADDITDEVWMAILIALMQDPSFHPDHVRIIDICTS